MPKLSLAKLERHLYGAADILRQEGMDAATYKDFIFGMLFLKRCSDTYESERERLIGRKVFQGIPLNEAQAAYGENPDFTEGSHQGNAHTGKGFEEGFERKGKTG
jgi:type I restriction enzyme M protein